MSYLISYDKKKKLYSQWLDEHMCLLDDFENIVMQKDVSDKIAEKLLSIGFATLFLNIVLGIVSFFGIALLAMSGVGIILFFIGILISRLFNGKVFGNERDIESLNINEKKLLNECKKVKERLKQRRTRAKVNREKIYFSYYVEFRKDLNQLYLKIRNHDYSNLAYKYHARYKISTAKYGKNLDKFEIIYTSKRDLTWLQKI